MKLEKQNKITLNSSIKNAITAHYPDLKKSIFKTRTYSRKKDTSKKMESV